MYAKEIKQLLVSKAGRDLRVPKSPLLVALFTCNHLSWTRLLSLMAYRGLKVTEITYRPFSHFYNSGYAKKDADKSRLAAILDKWFVRRKMLNWKRALSVNSAQRFHATRNKLELIVWPSEGKPHGKKHKTRVLGHPSIIGVQSFHPPSSQQATSYKIIM